LIPQVGYRAQRVAVALTFKSARKNREDVIPRGVLDCG